MNQLERGKMTREDRKELETQISEIETTINTLYRQRKALMNKVLAHKVLTQDKMDDFELLGASILSNATELRRLRRLR